MGKGTDLVIVGAADGTNSGEHAEIRRQVLALRDKSDDNAWALAQALTEVQKGGYYHEWAFDTWKDYVEKEVDILIRKAQYLIRTEEWLTGLPKAVSSWVRALGWRKARMLVGVVTAENAAEWRAKIQGRTAAELDEMLHKDAQEAAADPDGKGADASSERQPPWKCKLTPAQRANVEGALEIAAKVVGCDTIEDRKGYLLDLVCTEYRAGNHGIKTVQEYLAQVERSIGLKLVAYDEGEEELVYGAELIDRLNADVDADAEEAAEEPPKAPGTAIQSH